MSEQPSNVTSAMDGMPWWLKAVMMFGNTFGLPSLILGFYLMQDAGVITNPVSTELQEIKGEMQELKGAVIQQGGSMKEIASQLAREVENRQMRCVMRAQTEAEKKACFPNKE